MKKPSLFSRIVKNPYGRYGTAVSAAATAVLISLPLSHSFGGPVSYMAALTAIAFCALYCGIGPSAVSAVLTASALAYLSVSPAHMLTAVTSEHGLSLVVFLIASAVIIAMGQLHHRENERLHVVRGELETSVSQRTSELDTANQGLRELTARLLQLQDEERRRIARELHDSVGQTLAALSMNLTTVSSEIERLRETALKVEDSTALVQQMNQEVRTISYLLHPPLLDEAGIASALRWYTEGFSERSKIRVELEISDTFGRLAQELETAIFRTVQECLTNIHRHSGSRVATIQLKRSDHEVRLKVQDEGSGITVEKLEKLASDGTPGVGIRGMRERLRQLGGALEIQSNENGTLVEARLPVAIPAETVHSVIAA